MTNPSHPIMLFDGVCNFCNGAVNFTLRRNKKGNILFAPFQSTAGATISKQYGIDPALMDSFVLIENGVSYNRSTAAIKVCAWLDGAWPLCRVFLIVPRFIRDGLYNWIAKHRYAWFGKKETCMIPTAEIRKRFL